MSKKDELGLAFDNEYRLYYEAVEQIKSYLELMDKDKLHALIDLMFHRKERLDKLRNLYGEAVKEKNKDLSKGE